MIRNRILLLLALCLVAKVGMVVARGPSPLVMDAASYWRLGAMAMKGDEMLLGEPIAYRTPAYPWLVGFIRAYSPRPLFSLVCIQGAMWLATIGMIAAMAVDICRDRRAAVTALALAVPMISSVLFISTVLTETTFVFVLVLHLWVVQRFAKRPSVPEGVFLGLTFAIAVLIRPIAQLVWIPDLIYLLVTWYWIKDDRAKDLCRRRGWITLAVACLVAGGCCAPWVMRNQIMFGKPMLTEFVGRNLWIVTFQGGSGSGFSMPDTDSARELRWRVGDETWARWQADESWRMTWTVSDALTELRLNDAATDRLMKRIAMDAISEAPGPFAAKAFRRSLNFWRTRATDLPEQVGGTRLSEADQQRLFPRTQVWGVKVPPIDTAVNLRFSNSLAANTLLMILTGVATMLLVRNRVTRPTGLWLATILIYFSCVTGILEIPAYRYRMVVEPIVLLVVVSGLHVFLFPSHLADNETKPA